MLFEHRVGGEEGGEQDREVEEKRIGFAEYANKRIKILKDKSKNKTV